jgi:aryl-alcohol dehydrogenase-like predicted oxidoreductase
MAHPDTGRELGSTGLAVSPIGLGLAALGRPAYITLGRDRDLGAARTVEAMERRAHEVLDAAFDLGGRYVDAARSYGDAERFLASWLRRRNLPTGTVTIGSKWGYRYTAGWRVEAEVNEVKDHSLEALRTQYAESRRILGDDLALYQIHSATLESGVLADLSVLGELARLAAGGLAIGLTASGPRQGGAIRTALEVRVDGVNPFSTVQATWNLLEPSAGPALAEAHEAGLGVIVKEAVANGRLTASGPAPPELQRVAEAHGVTPDAVAVAAVLAQPWTSVCLSGAVTTEQLWSNAAALDLRLTEQEVQGLASLAEPPEAYWRTRAGLPWR